MLAGSPLSYWAGVRGKNPMRYLGGLLGGTWLTALTGDLGNGIFDGANLVANFESLNPANTYWEQALQRLFQGRHGGDALSRVRDVVGQPGAAQRRGDAVDRRQSVRRQQARHGRDCVPPTACASICATSSRRSSCSAPGATTSRRRSRRWTGFSTSTTATREIVANGQTIVYTLHQSIGHLGIFVSGKVAQKEHGEFVSDMELIDVLPPGLYEAPHRDAGEAEGNRALIKGDFLFRLENRTLDDIRAFGVNTTSTTSASQPSHAFPRSITASIRPSCSHWSARASETTAAFLRDTHPHRLRLATFSDRNPAMASVKAAAETVRAHRNPSLKTIPSSRWSASARPG